MKFLDSTCLLRFPIVVTLLAHSLLSLFTGGVNDFVYYYLNEVGFAPLGVPLAWAIKLSHVAAAMCFLFNRYLKLAGWISIFIFTMGIIMLHAAEGWFVVGAGHKGMEFNFLLILVILYLMYPRLSFTKELKGI